MRKIALTLIVVAAVGAIVTGVRYGLTPEYMPYHAAVAGKAWNQLEPGLQAVILGMLKIIGASFVGYGVSLLAFAWGGWRGDRWPALATAILGLVVCSPTLYVTLFLRKVNPRAETPVGLTLLVMALTLLGAVLLWIANRPRRWDAVDTNATTVQAV